jgi:predicted adenine nucleotide alpha hydrolase (AANH) superfamily ATPase
LACPIPQDLSSPLYSETMSRAIVLDATGKHLSPCSTERAQQLLAEGRAELVADSPLTIQLPYRVPWNPKPKAQPVEKPGEGHRLLLHICCGPCSTYTIERLRELGFALSGFWYNPNIHPFAEHERRRDCVQAYAVKMSLPMVWYPEYEMPLYFRAVAGHEAVGERCAICYRLRLQRAAQVAREQGFDAFSTTLLISPYQQQATIRSIGEEQARQFGLQFYFENFRRGWSVRGKIAREHKMYQQRYCGCVYSEWEAQDKKASTGRQPRKNDEHDEASSAS